MLAWHRGPRSPRWVATDHDSSVRLLPRCCDIVLAVSSRDTHACIVGLSLLVVTQSCTLPFNSNRCAGCRPCILTVPSISNVHRLFVNPGAVHVLRHPSECNFLTNCAAQTTATGGLTSGSGAAGADRGEEPDVASPRKRRRAQDEADDSEQGLSGGQRHSAAQRNAAARGRMECDPLASWFQRHFAALDGQSTPALPDAFYFSLRW